MLRQMFMRGPSNPVVIAVSVSLILIFLLVQFGRSSVQAKASNFLSMAGSDSNIVNDVFNTTLGFEKIFVVGLRARTDRRDGMVLSAALSNMNIEFVDGVRGETVLDKAIPSLEGHSRMADPVIGCWRAHMNAIQEFNGPTKQPTALILEDDADWDVRIKEQLHDLALSSHALTQPLSHSPSLYADSTYPTPPDASSVPASDLSFDNLPSTIPPKHSPYGDNWDFISVGHCGMRFPSSSLPSAEKIPEGRVIRNSDPTVPERHYLKTVSPVDDLKNEYANHTRAVHHVQEGICSLGYAITQAGARKLLHAIGLLDVTAPYDILLRQFCEGSQGRKYHNCLTVQPSLFIHHRPAGSRSAESDISDHGKGYREIAHTDVLRWSTRMNWDVLLEGRMDFVDQWPDAA